MHLRPLFGYLMEGEEREISPFINSPTSLTNDLNHLVLVFLLPRNEQPQWDSQALGISGAPLPLSDGEVKVRVHVLYTRAKYTRGYVLRNDNTSLRFGIFNFHTWPANVSKSWGSVLVSFHLKLWVTMPPLLGKAKKTPYFLKSRGYWAVSFALITPNSLF